MCKDLHTLNNYTLTRKGDTMSENTKTKNETGNNVLIIRGVEVVRAYFGGNKFNPTEKNHLTLKGDIPYDKIFAYKNVGSKLTPTWYKKREGYMNLASLYDVPVRTEDNCKITFSDWLSEYNPISSEVTVKVIQKEGTCYPVAIDVIKDGEEINPFLDM